MKVLLKKSEIPPTTPSPKSAPSYKVTKWHWEDENEKAPSEKVQVPDEVETVLSKDGNTATFTEQEFEDLQECVKNGAKETLERLFYKRALEQQHKK